MDANPSCTVGEAVARLKEALESLGEPIPDSLERGIIRFIENERIEPAVKIRRTDGNLDWNQSRFSIETFYEYSVQTKLLYGEAYQGKYFWQSFDDFLLNGAWYYGEWIPEEDDEEDSSNKGESTPQDHPIVFGATGGEALSVEPHPKALSSLLRMILAMAVDGYGYDPDDKKSPIPKQIADAVEAKLGLKIEPDTTRKWLREAASEFPIQKPK